MPQSKKFFQLRWFHKYGVNNIIRSLSLDCREIRVGLLFCLTTTPLNRCHQTRSLLIFELKATGFHTNRSPRKLLMNLQAQVQGQNKMKKISFECHLQDDAHIQENLPATSNSLDENYSIRPRPYQQEMFEESLNGNIIIAMDTGSGKTHVAVMRIKFELERLPQHKFIWFLAPTVSLCLQQSEYIKSHIPSAQLRLLSSANNVDRWTEQHVWDAVLKNINIVVSTYQILLDALIHGFVKMDCLTLIIFDEAHNCVGKNPGAKLMSLFYHPRKASGQYVPHIMGLTASPVMGSKLDSLAKIETTLDSLARTPVKNRLELRKSVHLPTIENLSYLSSTSSSSDLTNSILSLERVCANLNIADDPFYTSLLTKKDPKSERKLASLRRTQRTWAHDIITSLLNMSIKVYQELGPWAADHYIGEVVSKAICYSAENYDTFGVWEGGLHDLEKKYLTHLLEKINTTEPSKNTVDGLPLISDKLLQMIEFLQKQENDFSAIIFARERAVVASLANLLARHPYTCERLRIGTMVGASASHKRTRQTFDLIDLDSQSNALSDFRSGKTNLLIGTSVLEEGIDIPGCNLVLCFQKPENLKSYIQRRGRARKDHSKLVLLHNPNDTAHSEYEKLELEMRAIYEDETRILEESTDQTDSDERLELADQKRLKVEKTGAILELDHALPHLYHFCATLPADKFVDTRPDFICTENSAGLHHAKIILPISVHESVRTSESQRGWKNEKNAIKDAAFEAYVALYNAGLISDNLLPLKRECSLDVEFQAAVETRLSVIKIREQINPWIAIAKFWSVGPDVIYRSTINFEGHDIDLYLPAPIPKIPPFKVYWDENTEIIISCGPQTEMKVDPETIKIFDEETSALIQAAFPSEKLKAEGEFVIKFQANQEVPLRQQVMKTNLSESIYSLDKTRLIRDHQGVGYYFKELLPDKPDIGSVKRPQDNYENAPENVPYLSLVRMSRRTDFMHPIIPTLNSPSKFLHSTVIPIEKCRVDKIPFKLIQFANMIPCIMRQLELNLIAKSLSECLLSSLNISDLSLVLTAICSNSAGEISNYQRLEFLGDNILKLCASIQIAGENPLWYESNLAMRKDHLVANARLARAAVEFGLDEYIVTKRFSSLQWHPEYVNELIDMEKHIDREISTKTLADVVESLIGASMLDGGLPKAISCMKLFLPELKWDSLENHRISLFELSPKLELGSFYNPLQKLLGYSFKKPSLLVEAITHASYISGLCSYERLEFLGDSILDYIVVQEIYPSGLSHMRMHELRTAFVNADLLAFLCMELHYNVEITDLEVVKGQVSSQDAIKSPVYEYKKTPVATKIPLYSFMRHDSEGILKAQAETKRRYEKMRDEISCALESGADYPWAALYGLRAEKFYSDIIEALLGAIWIDSGSLQVVASVVERMRIIKLLRRAITENLNTEHPKITLGKLADTSQVRYELSKDTDSTDGPELICKVLVDDEEVANVRGGVSRHDMETRAAIEAIDILKSKSEKQREKLKRPRDPEEKSGPSQSEKNEFMARDW